MVSAVRGGAPAGCKVIVAYSNVHQMTKLKRLASKCQGTLAACVLADADVPFCMVQLAVVEGHRGRAERRVSARSPGPRLSLSVTLSIGIAPRPTFDSAPVGLVCRRPMGR